MDEREPGGPLQGVTVIEMAGLGALPFGTQKLADMGADVIRVHRVSEVPPEPVPFTYSEYNRGRRSIAVDLKHPEGVAVIEALAATADAFVESFRPGVCERLGIGPDDLLAVNPRLVYGRLTGWGQDGPLAHSAGHSLNYEAITGAIGSIGPKHGAPIPLLQVLGDFAGGGLHLAYGVVCALFEAQRSGHGQVVDTAMVDGVMALYSVFYGMARSGMHTEDIGTNFFDGGSPSYNVYETSDGQYVTLAPIEPQFYAELLARLELDPASLPDRDDPANWDALFDIFQQVMRTRTRDEWEELLGGTDVCFAPVYRLAEAPDHPHNVARGAFTEAPGGGTELVPAPRLSRTPGRPGNNYAYPGADTDAVLRQAGLDPDALRQSGAVG
ncbi:CaiB/BaiF CoA transferase family protein [Rhabdothermincola salaria]|uniref:CaiB/BaiF CoA transferase family protein n=1 Tax=Rhabdothermincola salaria TaxID=2903142 RepID=UPI001E4FA9C9|nr:CoA transferase [Rhabdothermincola salaria]